MDWIVWRDQLAFMDRITPERAHELNCPRLLLWTTFALMKWSVPQFHRAHHWLNGSSDLEKVLIDQSVWQGFHILLPKQSWLHRLRQLNMHLGELFQVAETTWTITQTLMQSRPSTHSSWGALASGTIILTTIQSWPQDCYTYILGHSCKLIKRNSQPPAWTST